MAVLAVLGSPLVPGGCQLGLPAGEDGFGTPFQLVARGDIADGTVQPRVVVVLDVAADDAPGVVEAKAALLRLRDELNDANLDAARSLEEGMEETLTLHRLGVFGVLGRSLKTTNCIESIFGQVEHCCGKVSNWKNSSQKQRWLATSLLDIEPRLRKIQGYKHLGQLREALQKDLGLVQHEEVA